MMAVKYSPVIRGEIHASVISVGLIGVYRATQLDYVLSDEAIVEEMGNEDHQFQPELHSFCVKEISNGN